MMQDEQYTMQSLAVLVSRYHIDKFLIADITVISHKMTKFALEN